MIYTQQIQHAIFCQVYTHQAVSISNRVTAMRHGIKKNTCNFKHTSQTHYVTHTIYMLQIKIKFKLKFFNYNTRHKLMKQTLFLVNFLHTFSHSLIANFVLTQMCPSPSPMLSHTYFGALRQRQHPNQHWGRGTANKCFKIFDEYCRFILDFHCLLTILIHIIRVSIQRKLRMNVG